MLTFFAERSSVCGVAMLQDLFLEMLNDGLCMPDPPQGKFDATQYSFFGEPTSNTGGLLDEALEVSELESCVDHNQLSRCYI